MLHKCSGCGRKHDGPKRRCEACLEKVRVYNSEHAEKYREYNRRYYQLYHRDAREEARQAIIDILGGVCAACGFSDRRILEIDHTNGGGRVHRKRFGGATQRYYRAIYNEITSGSQEYQLLCPNCHAYKDRNIAA